jgi:two-component system phosphate regulon response regulator OmpR
MLKERSHILVVDDDKRLRELIQKYLNEHGYLISSASTTKEARQKIESNSIDLIVLDLMLPEESGLEFLEKLRADIKNPKHTIPILMLTALGEVEHRIQGLERGADDYLPKPFEPKELLLRIHRILKRIAQSQTKSTVKLGKYHYDATMQALMLDEQKIHLTSAELSLMQIFASNPGIILTREELAERSGVSLSPRTVDVQITRLRKKIEDNPKQPYYLRTVRHQGYLLWPDQ